MKITNKLSASMDMLAMVCLSNDIALIVKFMRIKQWY
jgi:hypothetical protein